jgi:dipeptidyl aminopeptidase/acylaminoacyl peptidase
MATGGRTRLSPDSGASRPEWNADGSQVFFRQQLPDSAHLLARPWDLSGPPRLVARGGRLAFQELSFGPAHGLAAMRSGISPTTISLASSDSLDAARPLFDRLSDMLGPRVSPSGKLLAFSSNETGRAEVYVTPIPGPGPRVLVSVDGGEGPMWSRDGKTLFFRPPVGDGPVMAATIVERPVLTVSRLDTLFNDIYQQTAAHANYDVFPDGRLLMMRSINSANVAPVTPVVVVHWQRLLENATPNRK